MTDTREVRHQKRRAQVERRLFEEGLKLMGAKGVHACKVEEITGAAGVGKGTFFTHFENKEAYVARLVDQVLNDLTRRVRPLGLAPTDAESLLAGMGAVHLRFFQLRPEAAALIVQACGLGGDDSLGLAPARRLDQYLDLIAAMLAPACEPLGWPAERAKELSLILFANSVGFFWFGRPLGLGADTPMALLDRLGRVLARGLAADGDGAKASGI
jgi:AcrR family transcriptional regulator